MPNIFVRINGLLLWVKETNKDQITILVPPTGIGSYGNVEPHSAFIVVPRETGCTAHHLGGYVLKLGDGSGAVSLPTDLAPLSNQNAGGQPVRAEVLMSTDLKIVRSRIVLTAGRVAETTKSGKFAFHEPTVSVLASEVLWAIPHTGNSLELVLTPFGGGTDKKVPVPKTSGDYFFQIFHVPHSELPVDSDDAPQALPGTPAHHFMALYGLLEKPVKKNLIPVFDSPVKGGNPVTCVGAFADSPTRARVGDSGNLRGTSWPG
jgi:hypothetical protein